jgi:hypothetical protein
MYHCFTCKESMKKKLYFSIIPAYHAPFNAETMTELFNIQPMTDLQILYVMNFIQWEQLERMSSDRANQKVIKYQPREEDISKEI